LYNVRELDPTRFSIWSWLKGKKTSQHVISQMAAYKQDDGAAVQLWLTAGLEFLSGSM
jgi:hypothetical protein